MCFVEIDLQTRAPLLKFVFKHVVKSVVEFCFQTCALLFKFVVKFVVNTHARLPEKVGENIGKLEEAG